MRPAPAPAPPAGRTLVPTLCVGAAAAVVAGLAAGPEAAGGVAVGLALVVGFFLSGRVPVRLGPDVPPSMSFLLLGLGYVLRITLLLVAFVALRDADWVDRPVLGWTVIAGALWWNAAQLWAHLTSRRPAVEPVPAASTTADDSRVGS